MKVALERSGGDRQPTLEELQGENLLQTLPPASSSMEGRWSKPRLRGLLPQPEEEEPQPFVLDLRNFPDLANADLGAQNPNIQVRILRGLGCVPVKPGLYFSVKCCTLVSPESPLCRRRASASSPAALNIF